MPIRVLLADNSDVVRNVVAGLLKDSPEVELVAECANFAETITLAAEHHPEVIVLDLHMNDEHTVSRTHLKSSLVGSRLLAISVWNDDETKALAKTMGAVTLLDKANLATELIPAIRRAFIQSDRPTPGTVGDPGSR